MSDWREFLGIQLSVVDAMETALRRVSAALSHDLNVPVVLTLPYPDARQREFGAVICAVGDAPLPLPPPESDGPPLLSEQPVNTKHEMSRDRSNIHHLNDGKSLPQR